MIIHVPNNMFMINEADLNINKKIIHQNYSVLLLLSHSFEFYMIINFYQPINGC
jgi:hypothetical protein